MEITGAVVGLWLVTVQYVVPRFLPPDSYQIVLAGPLTGPNTLLWEDLLLGAEEALSQQSHDVRKRLGNLKVEVVRRDDGGLPAEAERLAAELVDRREVLAVIGHAQSSVAEAALGVYRESSLPVILPISTNPDLTRNNLREDVKNVFRLPATDEKQVECLFEFTKLIAAKLCGDDCHESELSIVIIQDTSNPKYTNYIAEQFERRIDDCATCPRILQRKQIDVESQEYVTEEMARADAEILLYTGSYRNAVKTVRQAEALEWSPTFILTDSAANSHLHSEVSDGTYVTTPVGESLSLSRLEGPPGFGAFGYDAMRLLSHSILSIDAGPLSRKKILHQLDEYKLSTFDGGRGGEYHFNAIGDNEHARFHVWQVSSTGWKHADECPVHRPLLRAVSKTN
jgi:ABC-type branched-subunit amino acid transport system substrate-binding protein